MPLGATLSVDGVNFSLYSRHATAVTLVLFRADEHDPIAEVPLDIRFNRTGDVWHVFVHGGPPGLEYGYRVDGPMGAAYHFTPTRTLLNPYARAVSGDEAWGDRTVRRAEPPSLRAVRRARVVEADGFDWGADEQPNTPLAETVIYELHVRGFTRDPSARVSAPGTYAGLVEKIPYLKALGVTAVELLPVMDFDEYDLPTSANPITGERLLNLWGYQPLAFFAPKAGFARDGRRRAELAEFKSLVKAMHAAGIEVFLDMVFNHTGEGGIDRPPLSFRGLDNPTYYMLDPKTGAYLDYTGCGNTFNANHPVVRLLILDVLRYWVSEMRVDGFRFDLASVLARGQEGEVLAEPPLVARIAADPVLARTKLIAEAWDASGLYQVGSFPSFGRWAEWNGRFRDDVRQFVRGDAKCAPAMATRLSGSPDLYRKPNRSAHHSVNFVTCHDGFTLADLVTYERKHNDENGEASSDGSPVNFSWNCGIEGPDAPPDVLRLRRRQVRNYLTLLLLSQGVPMLLGGDELGRTQRGNNNAYCQDTAASWVDWSEADLDRGLARFTRLLIALRRSHAAFREPTFLDPLPDGRPRATWHGRRPFEPDWSEGSRLLVLQLGGEGGDDLLIAANMSADPVAVEMPSPPLPRAWAIVIDTAAESPDDFVDADRRPSSTNAVTLEAHTVLVCRARG